MALQGAIQGEIAGKKIVRGMANSTATGSIDLSSLLQSIDTVQLTYESQQLSTNCFISFTISGTTINVVLRNSTFGAGSTSAAYHWLAIGDAPL